VFPEGRQYAPKVSVCISAVFENLEAGATIEEIIEQFDVTREQINAVLEFAARSLDAPPAVLAG
jgi:uncharacterized protein (DUF433 family)